MIWEFSCILKSLLVINNGSTGPDFVNSVEVPKMFKKRIRIHPQALIGNFKPIISHRNPKLTIKNANKSKQTLIFFPYAPIEPL